MREEVDEAVPQAGEARARRDHAERREPAETGREDQQQDHAEQEVRRGIQDQRRPVPDVVHGAAASPPGVGAERKSDDDRDELAEPEQDDRGPDPLGEHLAHRLPAGHEGVAQVTRGRGGQEADELVGEDWVVEAPAFTGLLEALLRHVRGAAQDDPFRRTGHRPEQQEVDEDDQEDRDRRAAQASGEVRAAHGRSPGRSAGERRDATLPDTSNHGRSSDHDPRGSFLLLGTRAATQRHEAHGKDGHERRDPGQEQDRVRAARRRFLTAPARCGRGGTARRSGALGAGRCRRSGARLERRGGELRVAERAVAEQRRAVLLRLVLPSRRTCRSGRRAAPSRSRGCGTGPRRRRAAACRRGYCARAARDPARRAGRGTTRRSCGFE